MGQYKAIVFDLGDVLIPWKHPKDVPVSSQALRHTLGTELWYEFERGGISEQDCYDKRAESCEGANSVDLALTISKALETTQFTPFSIDVL